MIVNRVKAFHPHPSPTQNPARAANKIPEFDVLRSFAILLLFLHHGGLYNFSILGFPLSALSNYIAPFLLGSFVFISGYLSVRSLQASDLLSYLKSKLVRIYIPYLLALALFIGFLDVNVSQADLAVHILGAQILLSPRLTTPIFTLWFIGMILAFYLLFGFLQKSLRSTPLLALAILLLFLGAGFIRAEWGFIARRFFYYYFVFATGVLLARTGGLDRLTSPRLFLVDKLSFAALGVAVFAPFSSQFGQSVSLSLVAAISLYTLATVLLALSLARLLVQAGLPQRLFSLIASASFFAYLLHRPIWKALTALHTFSDKPTMFLYLVSVGSVVILGTSYLLQILYDRLRRGIDRG